MDEDEVIDDDTIARIADARAELDRGEGLDAAALRDFLGAPRICFKLPDGRVVQAEVIDDDDTTPFARSGPGHDHIFEDADGWVACVCECPECMATGADGAPDCICPQCRHNARGNE